MAKPETETTVTTTTQNHPIYASFLAQNFVTDPVFCYVLGSTPWYRRPQRVYSIIRSQLLAASYSHRGLFVSASASAPPSPSQAEPSPHCTAVILPPGEDLLAIGLLGWASLLVRGALGVFLKLGPSGWNRYDKEYLRPVEEGKASIFSKKETYYYIFIIATGAEYRGKGLAQKVLGEVQAKAQAEMKPIWLESSSPASRRVYLRCGFVDVGDCIVLGRGKVNAKGLAARGEEAVGVPVWRMVWWPEGYKKMESK